MHIGRRRRKNKRTGHPWNGSPSKYQILIKCKKIHDGLPSKILIRYRHELMGNTTVSCTIQMYYPFLRGAVGLAFTIYCNTAVTPEKFFLGLFFTVCYNVR